MIALEFRAMGESRAGDRDGYLTYDDGDYVRGAGAHVRIERF